MIDDCKCGCEFDGLCYRKTWQWNSVGKKRQPNETCFRCKSKILVLNPRKELAYMCYPECGTAATGIAAATHN